MLITFIFYHDFSVKYTLIVTYSEHVKYYFAIGIWGGKDLGRILANSKDDSITGTPEGGGVVDGGKRI